ncbi:hypothetical protein B0A49_12267 [Cryomyces minteri]|uniref:PIN domain-containing protein n=1 Tax=Cryomyces minteri TaxID=331657 RepID=A0A4U0WA87_9PEZI|nr:hypothetical protein B0A49_12267 [Cryomyces minteri]
MTSDVDEAEHTPVIEEEQGSEEDSSEMSQLKEEKAKFQSELARGGAITAAPMSIEAPQSAAGKMLLKNYTAMVCDTKMLMNQRDVFSMLADSGSWRVVVPNGVVTELSGLTSSGNAKAQAAKDALNTLNTVISNGKNVRVVTAEGTDVTGQVFYKEHLSQYNTPGGPQNTDDVILRTARRESDLIRDGQRWPERTNVGGAKPAMLLTEDRNMRVKATTMGVASIATSMLRSVLTASRIPSPGGTSSG